MTRHKLFQYLQLILGSLLFAAAVRLFLDPEKLNSGGLIGLAQILSWITTRDDPNITGLINLAINIPLFLLACKGLSSSFLVKTLLSVAIQTLVLNILPTPAAPIMNETLANVLVGGVIAGLGIGLCLRAAGCAGGMDILGMYFSKVRPSLSVGKLSSVINCIVLSLSACIFSLQTALYSLIFSLCAYAVSDRIHLQNINVWAMIITEDPKVKQNLARTMGRGVTWWKGEGAWSGNAKEILVTAINQYEVRQLKTLVKEQDPEAFVIINKGDPVRGNFQKRLLN